MKLSDFDYNLPEELVALRPNEDRDGARLLILDAEKPLQDSFFYNIDHFLKEGDLLVFNDSRVIKARLTLDKAGTKIHVNLNKEISHNIWSGFAKPGKKLLIGDRFDFGNHQIIIKNKFEDGTIAFEFVLSDGISVFDFLEIFGSVPIPPYIRDGNGDGADEDDYQTIYANKDGSVAAPTAGLHFSDHIFVQLNKKNIDYCFVTLHVGAGTFLPVKTEDIEQHKMHSEYAEISNDTAEKINLALNEGRRVIAVGTTSLRTIEASATLNGKVEAGEFETDIFIKPGYKFKVTSGLITNFHLPKSTLMMLVSAFAGHKKIMEAYQYAIENKFKFYSYGDGMLILPNRST